MTMFRRGLKENVKDELMRNGGIISTLDILIRTAIDIDDKLYERAMEKKYSFNPRGSYGFHGGIKGDNRSFDPMDLSATQRRRKPGPKKQMNKKVKGKGLICYACGKEGHMARDCRSKGKVPRTQFNHVSRSPKELNVVQLSRNSVGQFMSKEKAAKVANHDPRTLDEGAICFDDNCEAHEADKRKGDHHYMLSKIACIKRNCHTNHLGFTGIPMEIRQFNMMIRQPKKATNDDPWDSRHPQHASTSFVDCTDDSCELYN